MRHQGLARNVLLTLFHEESGTKMSKVEQAVSLFREGFLCSQAVLATYGPGLGLDRQTALKLAGAFGGGMCRMGETCGAVTGALMVIGLKHGCADSRDKAARETTYALARQFVERFKSRNDAIRCKALLGCDISTREGLATAREEKLFEKVCPKYVRDAAEIIEQTVG
jgi:C_GCAxxG_C_C family probable redox protein